MNACPNDTCSPAGATSETQCAAPACDPGVPGGPSEQVHLSVIGVPGVMHVAFAVDNWACAEADVRSVAYGLSETALDMEAFAYGYGYTSGMGRPLCLFDGDMAGLAPNTRYFYRVEGLDETFSFVNEPRRAGGNVYAVFGDMGAANDVSAQQLVAEAKGGVFDMILYSGDYAYDFPSESGAVGNLFMNILQPVAARAPWQGVVGNHERAANFSQWRSRFFGYKELAKQSFSDSPLWHSFDHGLLHVVGISSEVFSYGGGSVEDMLAWLEADLKGVDRAATPWVVVLAHKDPWMGGTDYSRIDPIFRSAGVDLLLVGHAHNYRARPGDPARPIRAHSPPPQSASRPPPRPTRSWRRATSAPTRTRARTSTAAATSPWWRAAPATGRWRTMRTRRRRRM